MNALNLLHFFDAVFLIALAAWVGSILFLSFGVAPLIFKVLEPEPAGRFVRALFPRYYLWGAICGAIALPAVVCGPLAVPELRGPMVGLRALLIIAGILIMFYCGNVLTPAINTARDAGAPEQERFDRLHARSVNLNSVVLVMGLFLLAAHAYRQVPQTSGIQERTVEQNRAIYTQWNARNRQKNQEFYSQYQGGPPLPRTPETQPSPEAPREPAEPPAAATVRPEPR